MQKRIICDNVNEMNHMSTAGERLKEGAIFVVF